MSSLREKQKKARNLKILNAARTVFTENGFSKARMDTIAEKAEVGVATLYTYFESKAGILAALYINDALDIQTKVDELMPSLSTDPAEGVLEVLDIYQNIIINSSPELTREVIFQSKYFGPIQDAFRRVRKAIIEQIYLVLQNSRDAGALNKDIDIKIVANIIVDLLDRHLNRLTSDGNEASNYKVLHQYLNTLFKGAWRAD